MKVQTLERSLIYNQGDISKLFVILLHFSHFIWYSKKHLSGPAHITTNIDFEGHDVVRSDGFLNNIDVASISQDEQK